MITIPTAVVRDLPVPRTGDNWIVRDFGRDVFQHRPELPGTLDEPARVVANWLKGDTVWAVWGARTAFLFVPQHLTRTKDLFHTPIDLHRARPEPADERYPYAQSSLRVGETPAIVGDPVQGPIPGMSPELWDLTVSLLAASDALLVERPRLEWLNTIERWNDEAAYRGEVTTRVLATIRTRHADVSLARGRPLTTRRSNRKTGPMVLIKAGPETIGEVDVSRKILTVGHVDRSVVEDLLTAQGVEFLPSLATELPPPGLAGKWEGELFQVIAYRDLFDPNVIMVPGVDRMWGPAVAVLDPRTGDLMLVSPAWLPLVEHVIAFHGLTYRTVVGPERHPSLACRVGFDAPEFKRVLTPTERLQRVLDDPTVSPELKTMLKNMPDPAAGHSSQPRDVGPRRVPPALRDQLPNTIVAALEKVFELDHADEDQWSFETIRKGIESGLTQETIQELLTITPADLALPEGFVPTDIAATPYHGPKFLVLQLKQDHPEWWEALPWNDDVLLNSAGRATRNINFATQESIARSSQPELVTALVTRGGSLRNYSNYPVDMTLDNQVRAALALSVLARSGIVEPLDVLTTHECEVCSMTFELTSSDVFRVAFTRSERICRPCMTWANTGIAIVDDHIVEAAAPDALKILYGHLGTLPSLGLIRKVFGADPSDAAVAVAARIVLPKQAPTETAWIEWAEKAGLVGGVGVRAGRGYISRANDGHLCRSLFERHVDDYFSAVGIEHESEPYWPRHEQFNPSGLRRADWKIGENTYVEAAGLMSDAAYTQKMSDKAALAEACGIDLILLLPDDVHRLDSLFNEFKPSPAGANP